MDLTPFHPDLAALGACLGIAGAFVSWRFDARFQAAIATMVAIALVAIGQAPFVLAFAVAIAALTVLGPPPGAPVHPDDAASPRPTAVRAVVRRGAGAAGGLLVLLALQNPSIWAVLLAAGCVGSVLLLDLRPQRALAALPTAGLLGAALVGTFCGAPDTEAAVLATAALVPTLLGSLIAVPRPVPGAHLAVLVLAAWICVDGYRGRPAGLTAAAVALTVVIVLAASVTASRNPPGARWAVLAVAIVASVASARTIGLEAEASALAIAASIGACLLVGTAAVLSDRAGSRRTPGA